MEWNLEEAIVYYGRQGAPRDQSALTALLKEIQKESGAVTSEALEAVCAAYAIPQSIPLALIRRIPGLRVQNVPVLEICSGRNCPRKKDLEPFARKILRENPGMFTIKTVPCMRLCGKGPNIRWDGQVYHGADEELLRKLLRK